MNRTWVLLVSGWLLISGCVRRSLTIRTEPPGALVYVNDQLRGPSPVSYDFVWYGWHRVTIMSDGYQRLDDVRKLRSPLYLWIPLDLVMELLPIPVRDQRTWSYTLRRASAASIPSPPSSPEPPEATPAPTAEEPDASR